MVCASGFNMVRHLACGLSAAILGGCTPSAPLPNPSDPGKMYGLSEAEIKQYIKYFHWIDSQPAGPVRAGGSGH